MGDTATKDLAAGGVPFDFRAMAEHTPVMLWTARPNGELDFVNQAVLDYMQRTFEEMVKWGWADWVHPDDLPTVGDRWSASLETGTPYGLSFRLRRAKDGVYRRHVVQALPVRDAAGRIMKWHGYCADVESLGAWE